MLNIDKLCDVSSHLHGGPASTACRGQVTALRKSELDVFLREHREDAHFIRACHFSARVGDILFVPGRGETLNVLWGIPEVENEKVWRPYYFSGLIDHLPPGLWSVVTPKAFERHEVITGFCLGRVSFSLKTRQTDKDRPQLLVTDDEKKAVASSIEQAGIIAFARALIAMPANQLGPQELLSVSQKTLQQRHADVQIVTGETLQEAYPLVATVGQGAARAPGVIIAKWRGSQAKESSPLFSIVGKGVCFDTGGLDLKGSRSMLKMKKDMGGAASALALALLIIQADLPIRLELRLGCVENAISGRAMRPLDVVKSRKGLSVEIGNTDAEGRLVLADLLSAASQEAPHLLIDMATLTGSARSALGPDIPAFFCTSDAIAQVMSRAARDRRDPLWQLPLWEEYGRWLESDVADINNNASSPMAGSVTAALFLKAFVPKQQNWVHVDSYAWHDTHRPGRPKGGDVFGVRALFDTIRQMAQQEGH